MMERNVFDTPIDRKGTFCTQWDYVADRFGVANLIPFTISDMDFAVPNEVYHAIANRVVHPIYGYSRWRNPSYLGAIVGWYERRFSLRIEGSWIYYSPSVMYSVAKMIQLLSEPNDGVAMLTPGYDAFFNVIKNNGRRLVECELVCNQGNYSIDFERLDSALSHSKILLFCNPHNPVGRVWSPGELKSICALAEKHRVAIISDDIHMDITFDRRTTPILSFKSSVPVVICSSPSKTFNTPSLGGSYVIVPDSTLGEKFEHLTRYTDYVNSPSILGVVSTIAAYQCDEWLNELLAYLRSNLEFVKKTVIEEMPLLDVSMPEGCYFSWIGFKRMGVSDDEMQQALIHKGGVAIMPSTTYGTSGFLRFHVGCPRSKIEQGLDGMKRAYEFLLASRA